LITNPEMTCATSAVKSTLISMNTSNGGEKNGLEQHSRRACNFPRVLGYPRQRKFAFGGKVKGIEQDGLEAQEAVWFEIDENPRHMVIWYWYHPQIHQPTEDVFLVNGDPETDAPVAECVPQK
ncbi:hypothetical protein VNI00_016909, partial [Paramarasmius palmivorus]